MNVNKSIKKKLFLSKLEKMSKYGSTKTHICFKSLISLCAFAVHLTLCEFYFRFEDQSLNKIIFFFSLLFCFEIVLSVDDSLLYVTFINSHTHFRHRTFFLTLSSPKQKKISSLCFKN